MIAKKSELCCKSDYHIGHFCESTKFTKKRFDAATFAMHKNDQSMKISITLKFVLCFE